MYTIKYYTEDDKIQWDKFVAEAINGTFLQSRNFLSYHPKGRFDDCSLLFFNKNSELVAVCPACILKEKNKKIFYSHKGATYGGVVLSKKYYKAKYVLPLIEEMENFLIKQEFNECFLRLTPTLFSSESADLLSYAFYYCDFTEFKEISAYIDYEKYKEDILANFSQGKRTHVHKCQKNGIYMKYLDKNKEIENYYSILCENLSKYNVKPVHTLDELLDFKNNRLDNECVFCGAFLDETMIAGGMIFLFQNVKVAHTQYLSAKGEYNKLSPITYVYYWLIDEVRKLGYSKLSWGICTEDMGKTINMNLLNSKEDYGSKYSNNLTYHKIFGGDRAKG